MSFAMNQSQQLSFDDSFSNLTEREKTFLKKSWAYPFAEYVFPQIDERPFAVLYSTKNSRPNTPINIQIGALLIKELANMSDDEIVSSLMFDVRTQYALHTTSFREQPLSDRTLGRLRERCQEYEEKTGVDLLKNAILSLSSEMAEVMKVDPSLKRMDSMMIAANIKKLSRLELIYVSVAKAVKAVMKAEGQVPTGLEHYLNEEDRNNVIYRSKSSETDDRMEAVLKDAETVMAYAKDRYEDIKLLFRVIKEQTVTENGILRLRTKEDGGMTSSVLQNPSDPDATFRRKAGEEHRGYIGNFMESSGENGSIIEDYDYEPNNYSDARFLKDTLHKRNSSEKMTLVADGGYSGTEETELAKSRNVDLVTTNLTGKDAPEINADFEFNEDGTEVLNCPAGHKPESCKYCEKTGQCLLTFRHSDCESCPHRTQCHPKEQKKSFSKDISITAKRRGLQKRNRSTEEFKKYCHFRNGVEAIPSLMRRKYHVDRIPARGRLRTKIFFGFKVAALNFRRFCNFVQKQREYCALIAERS